MEGELEKKKGGAEADEAPVVPPRPRAHSPLALGGGVPAPGAVRIRRTGFPPPRERISSRPRAADGRPIPPPCDSTVGKKVHYLASLLEATTESTGEI